MELFIYGKVLSSCLRTLMFLLTIAFICLILCHAVIQKAFAEEAAGLPEKMPLPPLAGSLSDTENMGLLYDLTQDIQIISDEAVSPATDAPSLSPPQEPSQPASEPTVAPASVLPPPQPSQPTQPPQPTQPMQQGPPSAPLSPYRVKQPGNVPTAGTPLIPEDFYRHDKKKLYHKFNDGHMEMGILARGFYINDQRVQWSGNEATFGAEGILTPQAEFHVGRGKISAVGEFYLNLPYDNNVYHSTRERASYVANFDYDPFEVSQLYASYQICNFEFRIGKFESPFGRYYSPVLSNMRLDAPFIRTEAILWRQTGFLLRWTPSVFEVEAGMVNGCEDLDTNSMKAVVARAGLNFNTFRIGASAFFQDGIGSEEQKEFKSHYGIDAMFRLGKWTFSVEAIYDKYGLRQAYNPDDIFWYRSIYYRQVNKAHQTAIYGFGYYLDVTYQGEKLLLSFNYGEYYPEKLHLPEYPQHDIVTRRFLGKVGWQFNQYLQWYGAFIQENQGFYAQEGRTRRGTYLLTGLQIEF